MGVLTRKSTHLEVQTSLTHVQVPLPPQDLTCLHTGWEAYWRVFCGLQEHGYMAGAPARKKGPFALRNIKNRVHEQAPMHSQQCVTVNS